MSVCVCVCLLLGGKGLFMNCARTSVLVDIENGVCVCVCWCGVTHRFSVSHGGRGRAEAFAVRCIPPKPNFISILFCDAIVNHFLHDDEALSDRPAREMDFIVRTGTGLPLLWEMGDFEAEQVCVA